MTNDCLFCGIVQGEVPAKLVYEDSNCVAFRDINPQAPVHVLIVPRAHIESLSQTADSAGVGWLLVTAADIAKREGVAVQGYRTVINTGRSAGQTVNHLHVHLLGGRPMEWPPG